MFRIGGPCMCTSVHMLLAPGLLTRSPAPLQLPSVGCVVRCHLCDCCAVLAASPCWRPCGGVTLLAASPCWPDRPHGGVALLATSPCWWRDLFDRVTSLAALHLTLLAPLVAHFARHSSPRIPCPLALHFFLIFDEFCSFLTTFAPCAILAMCSISVALNSSLQLTPHLAHRSAALSPRDTRLTTLSPCAALSSHSARSTLTSRDTPFT